MRQPISRSISDREKNTNGAYPHWVVLVIVTFLTLHVIAEPIIVFSITKKWYSLAPATDLLPISYAGKHMLLYFFPKELQDYELEKEKIWAKVWARLWCTDQQPKSVPMS